MTRIDHENQNRLDKARMENPRFSIAAAPEMKTFRGVSQSKSPKINSKRKPDLREPCKTCGQKLFPKNISRHDFLCHNQINCPICNAPYTGQKKLGRHIKRKHGHNAHIKFKQSKFNKAEQAGTL